MKLYFYRNKITYPIFVFTLFLLVSCASEDESPIPKNDMYLEIPDVHFETKLIELDIDKDGIVNQQMLRSDAEAVRILNLNLYNNSGKIEDLTGIEGFINMTLLSVGYQKLEDIDLSNNILLDTLYILGNRISNIDLSHNRNLIFADLQSNEFSSASSIVGLSEATNLKDLDLSWNYLEEFSIHNESLEVLHMSHNELRSLDTGGLRNLKYVYIPSNKLETVDFSTSPLLKTLLISDNKLQQIYLEKNTDLTHLYIVSNSLRSLDISNNSQLEDLRVIGNPALTCIKIEQGQNPFVMKSDDQELNTFCN